MWPKKDVLLQFRVLICFVLLAAGRAINLYVPIYSKLIGKFLKINLILGMYCYKIYFLFLVDSMGTTPLLFRWDFILIYVFFKFLQGGGTGGMGVLNNLRSFLWIRIQQYTTREVEVDIVSNFIFIFSSD